MYQMPGEVIHAEQPGFLGLTLYQVAGIIAGFMISDYLGFEKILAKAVFIAAGVLLTRKSKGMYVIQRLYYQAAWFVRAALSDEELLDPSELYQSESSTRQQDGGRIYIVRRPDGRTYTVTK